VKITPKYIVDRTFGREENENGLREVFELQLKPGAITLLETEKFLLDTVTGGGMTLFGVYLASLKTSKTRQNISDKKWVFTR
jgi:hypothetical protein